MSKQHEWASENLLDKAIVYGRRAIEAPRNSSLYGFWSSLSIELLARAALAKIHPVLLADPRDVTSILSVFAAVRSTEPSKSIPAKTVYSRCVTLVDAFDEGASNHCMTLASARNKELHSGEAAFEAFTHNRWQREHYRVVKILCEFLECSIDEFFTTEEVRDIEEGIKSSSKEIEERAKEKVKTHKKWFAGLAEDEREKLRSNAEEHSATELSGFRFSECASCPACASNGLIAGDRVLDTKVRLDEATINRTNVVSAARYYCGACKLDIGKEELVAVSLPGSMTVKEEIDPVDHFGIDPANYFDINDLDPSEVVEYAASHGYYISEPDYGNE